MDREFPSHQDTRLHRRGRSILGHLLSRTFAKTQSEILLSRKCREPIRQSLAPPVRDMPILLYTRGSFAADPPDAQELNARAGRGCRELAEAKPSRADGHTTD